MIVLIVRCDNQTCKKEIPEGMPFFILEREVPHPTVADDLRSKHFCSLGCVSEFAGRACGWTGDN